MTGTVTSDISDEALRAAVAEKIAETDRLIDQCRTQLAQIAGAEKLANRIRSERSFLSSLLTSPRPVSIKSIGTSNLVHFSALVSSCTRYNDVVAVLKPVCPNEDKTSKEKLCVDLIVDGGSRWVKVIARNARSLYLDWVGANSRSGRCLTEQAHEYKRAADNNPYRFTPPVVTFDFVECVPDKIADELRSIGVNIKGTEVPISNFGMPLSSESEDDECCSSNENTCNSPNQENTVEINCVSDDSCDYNVSSSAVSQSTSSGMQSDWVNLDVTALIVLVSNLTNGHANYNFKESGLDAQAELERAEPALPQLLDVIRDKQLMCCRTAYDSFTSILSTVAGPNEKQRSDELLKRVTVVDDCVTQRVQQLKTGDRMSKRAQVIFGTGDHHRVLTLTANKHFVSSAAQQGVQLVAALHESRALTEDKQSHATPRA